MNFFAMKLNLSKSLAFLLVALVAYGHAAEVDKPESYALRFALQTQTSAGLQRLALPSAALGAIQTSNLADIRVFNASGEAVPIALLPQRAETKPVSPRSFTIYPINVTEKQRADLGGMRLRIEEAGGRRVVTLDSAGKATPSASAVKQIGALVDSNQFVGKLDYLLVDAELPIGEPVPISVSASKDLKSWRTLADASPVFRFGGDGSPGNLRVALNGAALDREYLRIIWPTQAAFKLRSAQLAEMPAVAPIVRSELPLVAAVGSAPNELIASMPFATPVHALALRAGPGNALIPVRIHARNAKNEPWRFVTSSVIYRIAGNNSEAVNPPIEVNGLVAREIKIEADKNSTAFASAVPSVQAIVNPVSLAFVASGSPPYALAVGRKDAKAIALPVSSLVPGYTEGSEAQLTLATVDASSMTKSPAAEPTALSTIKEKVGAPSERSLVLWGVLIVGVLLLGLIAWGLLKQSSNVKPPESN